MDKKTGGPAFPHKHICHDGTFDYQDGMTLRDYFAAHAPGMPPYRITRTTTIADEVAWRFEWADAMLAEREK